MARSDAPTRSVDGAGCGVSYVAVVEYSDQALSALGLPATTDTLQICQTWTGSDFATREVLLGRARSDWYSGDPLRTVTYAAGVIHGYAADGSTVGAPTPLETGNVLDEMRADPAVRQAIADDPYFALYSGDGPGCSDPNVIVCSSGAGSGVQLGQAGDTATAPSSSESRYRRHGLSRRGVRALVDAADEVRLGSAGARRFRHSRSGAVIEYLVDRKTGLLVGEEAREPNAVRTTRHTWRESSPGTYVRSESTTEYSESARGDRTVARTTVRIISFTRNPAADRSSGGAR